MSKEDHNSVGGTDGVDPLFPGDEVAVEAAGIFHDLWSESEARDEHEEIRWARLRDLLSLMAGGRWF